MRIALGIEYDGTYFHGWQSQINLRTVQGNLEHALAQVANHPVTVYCAGRTDTGVHATGQVIHFETNVFRTERAWLFGTNANLPKDICVRWIKGVDEEFHARYSAIQRSYRYIIYNQSTRPAVIRNGVTWHYRHLDEQRMQAATQYLLGEHDFTSYRALGCQAKSPLRVIHHLAVSRREHLVIIDITANAFLHHMVRNIAGVLIAIGAANYEPIWAKEVLEARNRMLGGVTAPPYGLYLTEVKYPEKYQLPEASVANSLILV